MGRWQEGIGVRGSIESRFRRVKHTPLRSCVSFREGRGGRVNARKASPKEPGHPQENERLKKVERRFLKLSRQDLTEEAAENVVWKGADIFRNRNGDFVKPVCYRVE